MYCIRHKRGFLEFIVFLFILCSYIFYIFSITIFSKVKSEWPMEGTYLRFDKQTVQVVVLVK